MPENEAAENHFFEKGRNEGGTHQFVPCQPAVEIPHNRKSNEKGKRTN